jgi:aspartate carbamoyltransferase regulatory subunit
MYEVKVNQIGFWIAVRRSRAMKKMSTKDMLKAISGMAISQKHRQFVTLYMPNGVKNAVIKVELATRISQQAFMANSKKQLDLSSLKKLWHE